MTRRTLPGNPPIEITLRRSARAKVYSLRVSRLDGRVTLSLPVRASESAALDFARDKADWIRKAMACAAPQLPVVAGTVLPVEGRELIVTQGPVRAVRREETVLLVPEGADTVGPRVAAYLKLAARQRLQAESERYAGVLGRSFQGLTLRDTRSRWGSCSAKGGLMYSWRLILAPPDVLSYVAAHEVAHLAEMNHSPAYWAIVSRLMPDYQKHRRWLKQHGAALHRYDFGA
ncbi:SprT family zinc-dependent metalloprotease [Ostreiculturibacter nitratireducens]|uniref:M48 family metallopeptidase n=1 Tax=Ostreiculturibacter nitratireducens TaxID=3075226 RepID=UPI0031B5F347